MLACGGLADTKFLGDKQPADAIFYEIAVDLRRKVCFGIFQPLHDEKALVVCERPERTFIRHIANLLNFELNVNMQAQYETATPHAIEQVERLIRPYIRRTPVVEIEGVAVKVESMQVSGSFKARGAFANLLNRKAGDAGVVAASGGNHGAAVAYAAATLHVPCKIYVPSVSSPAKIERIRAYGAELVIVPGTYSDALEASLSDAQHDGAIHVHAFDGIETVLGQGTIAKEISEQAPQLDTVLVAVGGGGLIAGVASWYTGNTRIVAVEPEGAPTFTYARAAGRPVDAPTGSVANDSLAPRRIGELVYPILEKGVERTVLVSDDDIQASRAALWEKARIVAEPGGAAAYAALLSGKYQPRSGERVGVIVSGGNAVISWT